MARLIGSFVILVALVLLISSLATDNLPSLSNLFGEPSEEEEARERSESFSTASPNNPAQNGTAQNGATQTHCPKRHCSKRHCSNWRFS
ncbi:MAG: hypothetical protein HC840_18920 [Leptolyngbyaceae cyanobacterium RM2_2_4]|nr:hypothetical protein [Leptolyngbyaceae cyanobacterium RM2_2_4]